MTCFSRILSIACPISNLIGRADTWANEPTKVPGMMQNTRGQSFLSSREIEGPVNSCQKFVTNEGIMIIAAAAGRAMNRLSMPIATVGRPMPVSPFDLLPVD